MSISFSTYREGNDLHLCIEDLYDYRVNAPGRKRMFKDLVCLTGRFAPTLEVQVVTSERRMFEVVFTYPSPALRDDVTSCFNHYEPILRRFVEEARKGLEASPRKVA